MTKLQAVKGMNDVMPEQIGQWQRVEERFRAITARYGYAEIRTPVVEPTQLFVRAIGEVTDVVEKEMYTFVDKGEDSLTLRPEGTAGAVRAYLEHSVHAREPVTRWIYLGPMFRRERPAKGRYRQFYQAGAEIFGDPGPYCDAEMIDMLATFLREVGVQDVEVLVNSLGGPAARARYRERLVAYFEPHADALSEDSRRRLHQNPLRILDSKSEQDKSLVAGAPSILDVLDDEDRAHFDELRRTLDAMGTPYRVEPRLVRGLDYYSRTLFEVVGRGGGLGAQSTICGGGRYDGLVEQLGGPPTPSIGFAFGLERVLLAGAEAPVSAGPDVVVAAASPAQLVEAALVARELRAAGFRVDSDLRGQSLKSQLRRADKLGARAALVLGESELARGVAQLKDLRGKTQSEVARGALVEALRALAADARGALAAEPARDATGPDAEGSR
jgi:histidyl-tRNA synthetase